LVALAMAVRPRHTTLSNVHTSWIVSRAGGIMSRTWRDYIPDMAGLNPGLQTPSSDSASSFRESMSCVDTDSTAGRSHAVPDLWFLM